MPSPVNWAEDALALEQQLTSRAKDVIEGLMEIAEMAMPDSYFAEDSRVNAARRWLEDVALKMKAGA